MNILKSFWQYNHILQIYIIYLIIILITTLLSLFSFKITLILYYYCLYIIENSINVTLFIIKFIEILFIILNVIQNNKYLNKIILKCKKNENFKRVEKFIKQLITLMINILHICFFYKNSKTECSGKDDKNYEKNVKKDINEKDDYKDTQSSFSSHLNRGTEGAVFVGMSGAAVGLINSLPFIKSTPLFTKLAVGATAMTGGFVGGMSASYWSSNMYADDPLTIKYQHQVHDQEKKLNILQQENEKIKIDLETYKNDLKRHEMSFYELSEKIKEKNEK